MLEVTAVAKEKLTEYLKTNNVNSSLRVALMQGGCSGPALGLALDEKKPGDSTFDHDDLTFLVEESILDQCGTITVDFIDMGERTGFQITSERPVPGAGGGCSSGSCSSGCGC